MTRQNRTARAAKLQLTDISCLDVRKRERSGVRIADIDR
jgi:hypothetical protein